MKVFIYRREPDLSFIHVNPGDWVVIKPNLIKECKENDSGEWKSVITSSKLIRLVCEHVAKELRGQGRITICDAPQTDSSFDRIAAKLGLKTMAEEISLRFLVRIDVVDLRNEEWTNENGVITQRRKLAGDPCGNIAFNLGRNSLFYGHPGEGRYYGADYDSAVVNSHHCGETQEYLICGTPINADVFINLPKMKTHKKTGVTLNLKNLVGINADKNWLPHHTDGSPKDGGDQFPDFHTLQRLEQVSVKLARKMALSIPYLGSRVAQKLRAQGAKVFGDGSKVIRSGNWHGNNTTWRMVLDLNRCLLYGNPDGTLRTSSPKRYFCLIDGRIGMEGSGPMQGEPISSGVVIGGSDPAVVDMVAARVMGFNWRKISMIRAAFDLKELPIASVKPADVYVESDHPDWNGRFLDIENRDFLHFRPHFGWAGQMEYDINKA